MIKTIPYLIPRTYITIPKSLINAKPVKHTSSLGTSSQSPSISPTLQLIYKSTMAASQDKVQGILQPLLQDSLPLVYKGIFTTDQLRTAMCQRERHENNMLRSTVKLSDFLTAIQFEYALERTRRFRIKQQSVANPLFRKQSKTDFVIVKRIIRLWDRATHKFKSNVDLWKQYLSFCVTSNSKKQFYKALSSALRFLPFQLDLWRIGVQYEVEVGHNLWKARKLYMKALKMNPSKTELWLQMFKFEMDFLSAIAHREKAIKGADGAIDFIMPQEEMEQQNNQESDKNQQRELNIDEHHEVLKIVAESALEKVPSAAKKHLLSKLIESLNDQIAKQRDSHVNNILIKAKKLIGKQQPQQELAPNKQKRQSPVSSSTGKLEEILSLAQRQNQLNQQQIQKMISQFIVKPSSLQKLLIVLLQYHWHATMNVLSTSRKLKSLQVPPVALEYLLEAIEKNPNKGTQEGKYIEGQVRRLAPLQFKENLKLLGEVIRHNKKQKNFKANNDIYRGLTIHCRSYPEVTERCLHFIQND